MATNIKDFATARVTIGPSPATSGTSLTVESGKGARFPAAPFYVTVHPETSLPDLDTAEKLLVTAVSTDTFTVVRAQGDTTAKSIDTGWRITNALFTSDLNGTNSIVTSETPTGSVNGSNTSFTTAGAYIGGTLSVFVNGLRQASGTHFTETTPSSGVFTMSDAPLTGDIVRVSYQTAASVSGNADTVDGIHANATPTANTLLPLDSNAKVPNAALPLWQNWSPTLTGFSANPTGTVYRYILVGKICYFTIRQVTDGTSNATAFTITLPFTAANITNSSWEGVIPQVRNNSTTSGSGMWTIAPNTNVMTLYMNTQGNLWTSSGGKRASAFTGFYEVE